MTCFFTQNGLSVNDADAMYASLLEMSFACKTYKSTASPGDNYIFDTALPKTDNVRPRQLARALIMHTLNSGSIYPVLSVPHWVTTKTRLNSLKLHQDIRFNGSRDLLQHYSDIIHQHMIKCKEFIEKEKGQTNV